MSEAQEISPHLLAKRQQRQRIWGQNPVVLLAALWVALMIFMAICDDVAAQTPTDSRSVESLSDIFVERLSNHSQRLEYYLSGAEQRLYDESQIVTTATSQLPAPSLSSSLAGDIRISESSSPARFSQSSPTVCELSDGSIIVAFEDERQGSQKIFLQKFSPTGVPIGANVLIAERLDGFDLVEPALAATISNKFYLGYRDIAAGQIRVARFNSDLSIDLVDFIVSDNSSGEYAGPFSLVARFTGEFAIAYESHLLGSSIALRRFTATGTAVGAAQIVNPITPLISHWSPDLAFDEDGGLGVVWEDYRTSFADIYLLRFDSLGNVIGIEVNLIDAAAQTQGQFSPSLVYSSIHGFVTGWSDSRSSWSVYMQRFSKQVGLVGSNRPVSALDSATIYLDVDLAVSATGLITATYCGYGATSDAIAQQFDASLTPIGTPITFVSEISNSPVSPALAIGERHALVWELQSPGDKDILLTVTDANLTPLTATAVTVNDDDLGAVSDQPDIAVVRGRSIITAFRDLRRDGGDVYVQASNLDGALVGANLLINEDNIGGIQSEPTVAANQLAYVVAWNDERFISGVSGSRIYVRFGIEGGSLNSNEILVSGDPTTAVAPKATPSVAISPNGTSVVTWLDKRSGAARVYARFIDANRNPLGNEILLSVNGSGNVPSKPVVSADDNNFFTVAWINTAAIGGPVINVRRYNFDMTLLGSFFFTSDQPNITITDFDCDVDNSGKVFLFWQGTNATAQTSTHITVFSNTGTKLGGTLEVLDNSSGAPVEPSVSVDEFNNILMAWVDSRGPERRIYTQNFNADMTPAGGNQPISLAATPTMSSPSVLAVRGRSWVGWVDARSEGLNVYLQGFVHFPTDVADDDNLILPNEFALKQNYPNPFNPSTQIAFTLPKRANLTLSIYNVLGQEIRELANGDFAAGEHQVLWDGKNNSGSTVASGLYFYRLRSADFTKTRKMTLLK